MIHLILATTLGTQIFVLPANPPKGECYVFDYGDQPTDERTLTVKGNGHLIEGYQEFILNTRFTQIEVGFDGEKWTFDPDGCE